LAFAEIVDGPAFVKVHDRARRVGEIGLLQRCPEDSAMGVLVVDCPEREAERGLDEAGQ
jgi:hypothetical protein